MVESKSCCSCIRPEGWLARGWVAVDSVHVGVGKWLNRRRPSDCGRKRAKSVRFASRDSRTIQRIGRDAGNCVAQTERGAFRSSSLGDKSAPLPEHRFATRYRSGDMRSVSRRWRASRPLCARQKCRALRPPLAGRWRRGGVGSSRVAWGQLELVRVG